MLHENYQPEDQYTFARNVDPSDYGCNCGDCTECLGERLEELRKDYSVILARYHHSLGLKDNEQALKPSSKQYDKIWDNCEKLDPIFAPF